MSAEREGLYGESSYKMLREQHKLACGQLAGNSEGDRPMTYRRDSDYSGTGTMGDGPILPREPKPPKACATCGGLKVVSSHWPSGYPHATPCPECRPGAPCGCGASNCPSVAAIEHWKRERAVQPTAPAKETER